MRLLIVGFDGATWRVIEPAIGRGDMPNLARFLEAGSHGTLHSAEPPITPVAWTSFMTGKRPDKHGIFDFHLFDRAARADNFVNSTRIQSATLWEYLNRAGLSIGIINLPMTFPPPAVGGFVVSGFDTPSLESTFTYPATLRGRLLTEVPDYDFIPSWGQRAESSPRQFSSLIDGVRQAFTVRTAAAIKLFSTHLPDVGMVQYQNLDVLQHKAYGLLDPTMSAQFDAEQVALAESCLRLLDEQFGRLLAATTPQNTVIVSDHGFGPLSGFLYPNELLRRWGYLATVQAAAPPNSVRQTIKGLPLVGRAYRLAGRLKWRVKQRLKREQTWIETARNSDVQAETQLDWTRTKAAVTMAELSGLVTVFAEGAEREGLINTLIGRFRAERNPATGEPLFPRVERASELYPAADDLPFDIVLTPAYGWGVLRRLGEEVVEVQAFPQLGTHRAEGVVAVAGDGFVAGQSADAHIIDIAPTLLHLLDVPVPDDMDGRVHADLLTRETAVRYQAAESFSADAAHLSNAEQQELEERLKALGYLG